MPTETIRYRAELDTQALQAQLALARNQIGTGIGGLFGGPQPAFGAPGVGFNMLQQDLRMAGAFAPMQQPIMNFGRFNESAYIAAQQTNMFQDMAIAMGIRGPPPGVFAGEFAQASREQLQQNVGLGVLGFGAEFAAPALLSSGIGAFASGRAMRGGMGATAAGLLGFGVGFAAFEVTSRLGETMVEGARNQRATSRMIQARIPGMAAGEREDAAARALHMAHTDVELGFEEVRSVLRQGLATGAFNKSGDVEEFTRDFRKLLDNVKLFTKAFGVSQQEAMGLLSELKRSGMGGMEADIALRARGIAAVTGMSAEQVVRGGMQMGSAFQQQGLLPELGMQLGMMDQALVAGLRQFGGMGKAGEAAVSRLGGPEAAAQAVTAARVQMLGSAAGVALQLAVGAGVPIDEAMRSQNIGITSNAALNRLTETQRLDLMSEFNAGRLMEPLLGAMNKRPTMMGDLALLGTRELVNLGLSEEQRKDYAFGQAGISKNVIEVFEAIEKAGVGMFERVEESARGERARSLADTLQREATLSAAVSGVVGELVSTLGELGSAADKGIGGWLAGSGLPTGRSDLLAKKREIRLERREAVQHGLKVFQYSGYRPDLGSVTSDYDEQLDQVRTKLAADALLSIDKAFNDRSKWTRADRELLEEADDIIRSANISEAGKDVALKNVVAAVAENETIRIPKVLQLLVSELRKVAANNAEYESRTDAKVAASVGGG